MPAGTPAAEVDGLFRMSPELRGVAVLDGPGGPGLLTRQRTEFHFSGRLGYGRALHARSAAADLLPPQTLVLAEDMSLDAAADLALNRPESSRYEDMLILAPTGPQLITVSEVFEQLSASFRHAAWHDGLTGLANRRWLADRGPLLLEKSDPQRTAILYIDLDNFKVVNDTYGHEAGDALLAEFARRLRVCLRDQDIPVRLGGDEFAAILLGATGAGAEAVAARVLEATSLPFDQAGHSLQVSATIGVATAADIAQDEELSPLDVLLRHADGAMLAGKKSGKQRVQRAPAGRVDPFARRAMVQRRLLTALDEDAFTLVYRPILDLRTGTCNRVEAALRWDAPGLGRITADEFIPVAERGGQLAAIGRWELEHVCRQARTWIEQGFPWKVGIRISSAWLHDGPFAAHIIASLAAHEIPAAWLRVSFVGQIPSSGLGHAREELLRLREAGIETALDGYGGHQMSLLDLWSLPFGMLNIAPALIAEVDADPKGAGLVASVVHTAGALDMLVSCDGVEREGQLLTLGSLGVSEASGPLVSAPLAPDSLPDRLAEPATGLLGADEPFEADHRESGAELGRSEGIKV
ncbi:putative bifunctional diguanylate cyclase/phosphodiesterase [Sinomonas susongensis]|uniref:putative bifunctional diguanylate cyclase/phosphodiesterase n=1 Tax=Sinomonas susongensis TaxID=1324851 RepID=UPI00148613E0|nr:EAL domain-containing protein [Sinomonas susongensis]